MPNAPHASTLEAAYAARSASASGDTDEYQRLYEAHKFLRVPVSIVVHSRGVVHGPDGFDYVIFSLAPGESMPKFYVSRRYVERFIPD